MRLNRIDTEKRVLKTMVEVYCRGHKHEKHEKPERKSSLCKECQSLVQYAWKRLDYCRFGEQKTFCEDCPVHCYSPKMRIQVKQVMRYSGPRMLIYHPIIAIKHMFKK
jgi:hypothetical protein